MMVGVVVVEGGTGRRAARGSDGLELRAAKPLLVDSCRNPCDFLLHVLAFVNQAASAYHRYNQYMYVHPHILIQSLYM